MSELPKVERCEGRHTPCRAQLVHHTFDGDDDGPFEGAGEGEAVGGAEDVVVGDAEGAFD